ncbi:AAA family ATPase [Hamadaea tsunoensis]|uniref:AAA family ATPase n=1 Tax=Hamadaea tsunoensis TaxID=53368 RepID=UPI0003F65661|nr:AAA family ATPase [Hamadaea tsunoensis]
MTSASDDGWEQPCDLAAERVVLGSMLLQPEAIELVTGRLATEDLYDGRHARLFRLLLDEYHAGRPTSLPAVLGRLADLGLLHVADGALLHRLINAVPTAATAGYYAERVRQMALRRRLLSFATRVGQLAAEARDRSAESAVEAARFELDRLEVTSDADDQGPTPIVDFLQAEVEYDWLVPGLLERGERMLLTAPESFGKSTLVRQIAVSVASGVHPFDWSAIAARAVLVIDCENPVPLNQRRFRPLVAAARERGWAQDNLWIECRPDGLDLTAPTDAAWLTRQVRRVQPDLLVVGPIYKLHNDDPNDEQVARRITKVIDYIRRRFGCAVMMEAHSPHGDGRGPRPVRPFGASLWRRWPDFGLGLRPVPKTDPKRRVAEVVQWKARDVRQWPAAVRAGLDMPWVGMSDDQLEIEQAIGSLR